MLIWSNKNQNWEFQGEFPKDEKNQSLIENCAAAYRQISRDMDSMTIQLCNQASPIYFLPCSFTNEDQSYISIGIIRERDNGKQASLLECIIFLREDGITLYSMIGDLLGIKESLPKEVVKLTKREVDVLKLIRKGYTQKKIADILNISISTVETYKSKLFRKFNVRSSIELIAKAPNRY